MVGTVDLLFRLKAENQASPAIKTVQADLARLRSALGSEFGQIQHTATTAFARVAQAQKAITQGELSTRQQLSAAASLQRQRSAALVAQFMAQERAALHAVTGVRPFREVLQNLSTTVATLQGPLGGIAGRISAVGSLTDQLSASVRGSSSAVSVLLPLLGGVAVGLGAVIATGVGLFKLAQSTATFGAHLKDLSDQTGISTESLSTLKVATDLSGGSIDGVNTTLARYLKGVSDANHGNEELRKKFLQVGFTANDLRDAYVSSDAAIRILLDRVGSLSSDQDRLNALQKLGVRNGTELNAVIKAMDGSFTAFQAKVRGMGLVITPEQAEAADKFDDSLQLLTLQIKGMAYSIAREYLPQIGGAISDVSDSLTGNQNRWAAWGAFIKTELIGVRVAASGLAAFLQSLPTVGGHVGIAALIGIRAAVEKSRQLKAEDRVGADASVALSGKRELGDKPPGKTKSKTDEIFKAELDASKAAAERELEQQRHLSESLKQAYELNIVNLENYYRLRQGVIDLNFNAEIAAINREQAALDSARARGRIKTEEAAKKDAELTLRTAKAQNELDEKTNQLRIDKQRELDRTDLDLNRQLIDIREAQREGELSRTQDLLDRQVITESEAIARRLQVEKEAHNDRVILIDLEMGKLTTSAARKIELDNLKIASEQRYTNVVEELGQQRNNALRRQAEEYVKLDTEAADLLRTRALQDRRSELERLASLIGHNAKTINAMRELRRDEAREHHNRIIDEIAAQEAQARAVDEGGKHKLEIEQRYNALRAQENKRFHRQNREDDEDEAKAKARQGGAGGFLEGLETGRLAELKDGVQSFADVAKVAFSAVGVAVQGLAQGVGNLVESWVLLGSEAGINIKKLVASVLAGVAQQAATLAIMSLAYAALASTGIGALLLGGTPGQFLVAAGLFAAVAAGAALVGRAVAGNDFQSKSLTGSAGSAGTDKAAPAPSQPKPIEIDRRRSAAPAPVILQPQITVQVQPQITIVGQATEGFRYIVEKAVVESFRGNGVMRRMIVEENA